MLKKLLSLFSLGLIIGSSVSAQQFSFQPDTVKQCTDAGTLPHPAVYEIGDNWDNIEVHGGIVNNTNTAFVYKWNVILSETILPSGWDLFGFCDNVLCRSPFGAWATAGEVQTSNPLLPGLTGPASNRDFKMLICAPSDKPDGTAVIRIRVAVDNGLVDTATFVFSKPCNPTGIDDLLTAADRRVVLSPNPASDLLRVYADKELNASKIFIFNILGSKQMVAPIAKEVTALDISSLAPGMYVMRLEDKNGKLITTRKFAKN